ncbi:MAG: alcohol dehydrogenase catalytic domain-containing protein [Planctomycetota bacterium]
MTAVRYVENQLKVVDAERPTFGPGEVLVRVHLAGICSTDLEITKGYFGFQGTLGHEFVGQVVAPDSSPWLGKRVVASINFADPRSPAYREFGFEHHPDRTVLGILNRDGAMAEYVAIPECNLFAVPDSVVDRMAVFAEPLAAALRIPQQLESSGLSMPKEACVIGPGRLGMLIAFVLRSYGVQTHIAGRSDASLALARELEFPTLKSDSLPLHEYSLVVDATGSPDGFTAAVTTLRPRGTLVLKSTFADAGAIDLTPIVVNEIHLLGSRCGPFDRAIEVLESGSLPLPRLIDGRYAIAEAVAAFEHAARPGVRKILLKTTAEEYC